MTTVLDRSQEEEVARLLLEMLDDTGYAPVEFIPGLILAARVIAASTAQEKAIVDEAADLLYEEE